MTITGQDLIVNRTNLSETDIVTVTFPDTPPDGSCLLQVDTFALTANNITYGVAADMLGYWDFFPTDREGFGRIPVWGFADVIASSHPEVAVGERVYGYMPMSTHLMVEPGKVSGFGFSDAAQHRAERSPIYNNYSFTKTDPVWKADPKTEAGISLFRPLFTTSFLLEDLRRDNNYFGAEIVIISSASSKTSIGLAKVLALHKPDDVKVVGLTSEGNKAFVESLGCYDAVTTYDTLEDLPEGSAAYVDMAGNADLRRSVHETLGDRLKSSTAVGMTHWQTSGGLSGDLPGPRPTFFFAPSYAQERIGAWGQAGFQARLGEAWQDFIGAANSWFEVDTARGSKVTQASYLTMLDGKVDPKRGLILSMNA